ncbi:MAG TPA: hypothetical protein VIG47_15145, partial [Gemmatimonadaceae bacterium]
MSLNLDQAGSGSDEPHSFTFASGREDLSHSFSMLESAFDATMDAVLIAGSDGHIFGFNASFAAMWRIPKEVMALRDDHRA